MFVSHTYYLLIILIIYLNEYNAYRSFEMDDMETVLAVKNENVTFECTKNIPMSYCGFIHPNGSRFSVTGPEVNAGRCEFKLQVTTLDNGIWKCHIGQKAPGLEIVQTKSVRVADRLAAFEQNLSVAQGEVVTLYCTTAQAMLPLRYCRFEPPYENPFSIGPAATAERPILSRFYYPGQKSLDRGDCAVTIRDVSYDDVGQWTCGAGFDDDGLEYTDTITLKVHGGMYTMSTASTAAGLTAAVVIGVLMVLVVASLIWRRRQLLRRQSRVENEQEETIEIGEVAPLEGTPEPVRYVPRLLVQSPSDPESPDTAL